MSMKSKGSNAERSLIRKFWETGRWAAMRAAGSGSCLFPSPDLIAGNTLRKLAIECKVSGGEAKYLTRAEVQELQSFALLFGAEIWIAVRFDRGEWYFFTVEDMRQTENSYVISREDARKKGITFSELIS